jgi:hypothetical protein
MIEYARPSVDNLINNLPDILKSSRQYLVWDVEAGGKKVPLKPDGRSWGNYQDPNCWRTFGTAIDLLDRRRAFGIGLVIPSPQQVETLLEFNLVADLVAFDGDAKRSSVAAAYQVPTHISSYIRSVQSYSEFSPSLKGVRALVFGTLPTAKQSITKHFDDGTELSLYRAGWVTLSGLSCADSPPTIEHRQEAIDRILAELWPELKAGTGAVKERASAAIPPVYEGENFILDWSRIASEGLIREFIQGWRRTPKQVRDITETWELNRGWNHGNTPDSSMYTKRIVEEALWLRPSFGWTLQDVVDIVITFCKKNQLCWSFGRAKKQIADAERYIANTCQRSCGVAGDFAPFASIQQHTTTLTCKDSQIFQEDQPTIKSSLTDSRVNRLTSAAPPKSRDTFADTFEPGEKPKVSPGFRHRSVARDTVMQALGKRSGWVKIKTIAKETGKSVESAKKQLQRLKVAGFVDSDGRGHYRKHHERKRRELKPCSSKPIPKCRATDEERKTLSRTDLRKRGWPKDLIDKMFPEAGKDYKEKEIALRDWSGRSVRARLYWVSRVKAIELQPWSR